ncbi:hypothetical protein RBH89_03355 [Paracidovorax avenae]
MKKEQTTDGQLSRRESIALAMIARERCKIIYFFPHSAQKLDEASFFGWYTPGILATARPIQQACKLPADIREAHSEMEEVLINRLTGITWPHLLPIEINHFEAALQIINSPFVVCITTNAEVATNVDQILQRRALPTLHISSISAPNRKSRELFTLEEIYTFIRKVIDALDKIPGNTEFVSNYRRILSSGPQRKLRKHPLHLAKHNVTAPNEIALGAFGYKFLSSKVIQQPLEIPRKSSVEKYVERICKSVDAVSTERTRLLRDYDINLEDNRAIVAISSSYAGLYRNWKDIVQKAPTETRRDFKNALKLVLRSSTYYFEIPNDDKGHPKFSFTDQMVTKQLTFDLRAFTAALSMLSSATLCPVLRLEPKLNSIRTEAAELARCVRKAGMRHAWKEARMMRLMGQKMRASIHPDLLTRIDAKEAGSIEGLKLVTDLPLELMPSNDMPLGLRFDISRISPLPGNMFWQLSHLPPIHIRQEAFYDILIIRSFEISDPIRNILQRAVNVAEGPNGFKKLKYRLVDVNTSDQFIAAVNSHKAAIMIFDGHGNYDTQLGIGRLVVGGKMLDTWSLKRECELPPVVMFSACDTQPIDGSHGSVATSAFALGARAVLGTMLPVNAKHAAIFMARMFLRIDQFLPLAVEHFPVLTWRHVVSGMLRMSHVVEATRALNARAGLKMSAAALSRIQMASNTAINSWSADWYDTWIEELAKESLRTGDDIRALVKSHIGLTDAMKYVQLGNPERIIIY